MSSTSDGERLEGIVIDTRRHKMPMETVISQYKANHFDIYVLGNVNVTFNM
jgi:hypothetical protein